MVKIADISTVSRKYKKIPTKTTDYFKLKKLIYDEFMDPTKIKLAQQLETWSYEDEKAFMISQFYGGMRITKAEFYEWLDNPQYLHLKKAHALAMTNILNRREMTMIEKDPSSLRVPHPYYSDIWRSESERLAAQKENLLSQVAKSMTGLKTEDVMGNL